MMTHTVRILSLAGAVAGVCLWNAAPGRTADNAPASASAPVRLPADAAAGETKDDAKTAAAKSPPAKAGAKTAATSPTKKQLTPAQVALRDRIRRTLAALYKQPFSSRDNTAADLINFCWGFGCESEVYQGDSNPQRINGITCLCWDFPCGGYQLLTVEDGHIAARVGYGLQEHPSQFLAMLAMSYVPAEYPIRSGEKIRTVADLVEQEKLTCRRGTNLSLKLIGLSCYVDQPSWKNSLGESWSIEKMVQQELAQPAVAGPLGISKLLALSCALAHREKAKQPMEGEFARARQFVEDFQNYAFENQNGDGSWSPVPLAGRVAQRDAVSQLLTSGQMAEWLALSLHEDRLDDPRMVQSIAYLDAMLSSQRYQWNVQSLSSRDIAAVGHAVHALMVYDQRQFKPADPDPAPAPVPAKGAKP